MPSLLRLPLLAALATTSTFSLGAATASEQKKFSDPAPPAASARRTLPPAPARENPDATFHAAPKPLAPGAVTADWPSFLGPTHNMVSPETALLKNFPADGLRPVWEMKKGEGFAAPAILGDQLILFHRVGEEEVVDCVRTTDGQRFWRHATPSAYRDRYGFNSGPRASPVIARGCVFTLGAEGRLQCLDLANGQLLWHRALLTEFDLAQNFFGVGATPLVEGDFLIVNVGAPAGPCVAAFDLATGKLVWGSGIEWGPSYASPIPATVHGKRRVFVFAGGESKPATGGLLALDPATGRIDFTFPWRGKRYESVNAASPVIIGNQIYLGECYGAGGVLLAAQPDGTARQVWTNPTFGMHFMSAIHRDGFLYGVHGHGPSDADLVCVELATGKERWRAQPTWQEKVPSPRGPRDLNVGFFRASLLHVADGRTLCLGEFGHLAWLDLAPDAYKELGRTWLFAATETWTPPVLSRGLLYVCQNTKDTVNNAPPRLLCYDLRGAQP